MASGVLLLSWLYTFLVLSAAVPQKPQEKDAPKTVQIIIDKVAFPAVKVPLSVGDTIEWINNDVVDHTATAKNKSWDVELPVGKRVKMVLKKAGKVDYFCRYHPNMTGTLTIAPRPAAPAARARELRSMRWIGGTVDAHNPDRWPAVTCAVLSAASDRLATCGRRTLDV